MASFFATDINLNSTEYLLSEEESKHCIRVLRYGIGSEIDLLDGMGNQFKKTCNSIGVSKCGKISLNQKDRCGRVMQ